MQVQRAAKIVVPIVNMRLSNGRLPFPTRSLLVTLPLHHIKWLWTAIFLYVVIFSSSLLREVMIQI